METKIVIKLRQGWPSPVAGVLSWDRNESPYGLPVVVVEGTILVPSEVEWLDGPKSAREAAVARGYTVKAASGSPGTDR